MTETQIFNCQYSIVNSGLSGLGVRVCAKITSHFRIPPSGHLCLPLNRKILEIVLLFLWICSIGAAKSDLNLGTNSAKLFLRKPLLFHKSADLQFIASNPALNSPCLVNSDDPASYVSKSFESLLMGKTKKVPFA